MAEGKSQRIEVLKTVYPIFKKEVYARRQSIVWMATGGCAVNLVLVLVGSSQWIPLGAQRWVIILAVVVFSFLLIYQIHQQYLRHKQAKHELIEIEKALEFFAEDSYLSGKALYPQTWLQLPQRDWHFLVSVLCLVVLTVLVVWAFLPW